MKLFLLGCLLAAVSQGLARTQAPKIEMSSQVKTKLEIILSKADELREALVGREESLATTRVRNLEIALTEALKSNDPDTQNKQHLDRILTEASSGLRQMSVAHGEERRTGLQNTFKAIVLIGQTYKLNNPYKFFFCNRDRSVWLQKENKPLNPINPENYLHCGTRVE